MGLVKIFAFIKVLALVKVNVLVLYLYLVLVLVFVKVLVLMKVIFCIMKQICQRSDRRLQVEPGAIAVLANLILAVTFLRKKTSLTGKTIEPLNSPGLPMVFDAKMGF